MITAAEKRNKIPFDWFKFLNKKTYTKTELVSAEKRSSKWTTCACGNQCAIIPRNSDDDEPFDSILSELGMDFYKEVNTMMNNHIDNKSVFIASKKSALITLKKIEKRSAQLIKVEADKLAKQIKTNVKKLEDLGLRYKVTQLKSK